MSPKSKTKRKMDTDDKSKRQREQRERQRDRLTGNFLCCIARKDDEKSGKIIVEMMEGEGFGGDKPFGLRISRVRVGVAEEAGVEEVG